MKTTQQPPTDWRREWRDEGMNPDRGVPDAKDAIIAELVEALEAINKASNALHIEAANVLGVFRAMELADRAGVARMRSYHDAFAASCAAGKIARAAIEKARLDRSGMSEADFRHESTRGDY